eukprot:CAMPEP_0194535192 /NCGR_PEP_ID=MMETSP0253-20130528/73658_1 /TAXON_ID=2966 /ORGANISM="Noctiluca scintillans" /LENGTH=143 /DNA_ID=CAMNT_0039380937 /DNA_START=299 /DNA_END=730 /DNA_ORIENTATION=+
MRQAHTINNKKNHAHHGTPPPSSVVTVTVVVVVVLYSSTLATVTPHKPFTEQRFVGTTEDADALKSEIQESMSAHVSGEARTLPVKVAHVVLNRRISWPVKYGCTMRRRTAVLTQEVFELRISATVIASVSSHVLNSESEVVL